MVLLKESLRKGRKYFCVAQCVTVAGVATGKKFTINYSHLPINTDDF
jgi:hypothetical protein